MTSSEHRRKEIERDWGAHRRGLALRELERERPTGWIDACLDAAIDDPHPFPRNEGAAALTAADDVDVVPRLTEILAADLLPASLWRAERILIRRAPDAAVAALEQIIAGEDALRRRHAAEVLGRLGPAALPLVARLGVSDDSALRSRAAKALGQIGARANLPILTRLVCDENRTVRLAAARAVLRLAGQAGFDPDKMMIAALVERLTDADLEVRGAILVALAAVDTLQVAMFDAQQIAAVVEVATGDSQFAIPAIEVLSSAGAVGAIEELLHQLDGAAGLAATAFALARGDSSTLFDLAESENVTMRAAAARGLARDSRDVAAGAALTRLCQDDHPSIRWLAERGVTHRLGRDVETVHAGRAPSTAASAMWPFGLPAPDPNAQPPPRLPLAVAAFNLSYNLNLGVLLRSAEAAGVSDVFLVGSDYYHRAAAMGADRWVTIRVFRTWPEMVAHARAVGYQLVALQQSPGAERYDRADYPPRPCLIVGSEGQGLPPALVARADLVVEIPQRGEIDSINVAAAATVVLWACLAQRGWLNE